MALGYEVAYVLSIGATPLAEGEITCPSPRLHQPLPSHLGVRLPGEAVIAEEALYLLVVHLLSAYKIDLMLPYDAQ
jgi:hypothetical protein